MKSLSFAGLILLFICCNSPKRECGIVVGITTENPLNQDTITATIKVKFNDYEREFKVRENAKKYPYTYWESLYPVDARFCIEKE